MGHILGSQFCLNSTLQHNTADPKYLALNIQENKNNKKIQIQERDDSTRITITTVSSFSLNDHQVVPVEYTVLMATEPHSTTCRFTETSGKNILGW